MTKRRLRRSPEHGRSEILEAAEAAVAELDWSELTVELLMERTGMTRSSFYHYFASLEEVALALFGRIEAEIGEAVDDWLGGEPAGDPLERTRTHLGRLFAIWGKHADLMRAIQQAGARDRRVYDRWRGRVVEAYVAKTADFIRREVARGLADAPDADPLARALIWMNTAVSLDLTSRPRPEPPDRIVSALARIWNSSIYGRY